MLGFVVVIKHVFVTTYFKITEIGTNLQLAVFMYFV